MTKNERRRATRASRPTWKKADHYVWCDVCGEIHEAKEHLYGDDQDGCEAKNWRAVAVRTDDPTEKF